MPESIPALRTVEVTRYVAPLREGGSLPALVEADDEFMYVVKFRGAGQGIKALIAELVVGELARVLGLRLPELVFCQLDEAFGRSEPDEEIQDLLRASTGQNLGLHYLSGAITFDPLVTTIEPRLASQIVWLDALTLNVDRTARNTNLLIWHKELWLIDHGAALYVHHAGPGWAAPRPRTFPQVKDHVLLPQASELAAVDTEYRARLTPEVLHAILALVPDAWLEEAAAGEATAPEQRQNYVGFLASRLAASETFVQEAEDARKALV
ncbi:aminotransferase class I and II [Hymenobacter aquaticus]|uniref:Aminotransferase class I and II n=1 Tax=Hymenobacter aquaticus TaxID=1867101 RepID=A0A4Z0Q518_9BACT|nr:HipA family kinase [Hymenobacter aquaticus]TGE25160.1 aminotransferase class I and II [Hymenobacter aquaticus]